MCHVTVVIYLLLYVQFVFITHHSLYFKFCWLVFSILHCTQGFTQTVRLNFVVMCLYSLSLISRFVPLQSLNLPTTATSTATPSESGAAGGDSPGKTRKISEIIDVVGNAEHPSVRANLFESIEAWDRNTISPSVIIATFCLFSVSYSTFQVHLFGVGSLFHWLCTCWQWEFIQTVYNYLISSLYVSFSFNFRG